MRNEMSESCRMSFSVSFAMPARGYGAAGARRRAKRLLRRNLRRSGRFAIRRRAVSEKGARGERPVVARPAGPGGQLLLQPVERTQAAAQVVDHVDEGRLAGAGHDRTAVLQGAVVGQDDVE